MCCITPPPCHHAFLTRSACTLSFFNHKSHQRNQQIGANAGIGLALTKQLVADYGCHVYLGSRDAVRGANAVDEVKTFSAGKGGGSVELLTIVSVVSSSRTLEQFVVLAGRWMILSGRPYRDSW